MSELRYIPVVKCGVCPYVRKHGIAENQYNCLAMAQDVDNDITFPVMNNLISTDCRLPAGKPEDLPEEKISDDDYLDEDDDTQEA